MKAAICVLLPIQPALDSTVFKIDSYMNTIILEIQIV